MQEANRSQLQTVNPLIKLVREHEDLYFQLLQFVTSHLTSSSNDLDNTTVFNKFILTLQHKQTALQLRARQLVQSLADPFAQGEPHDDPISKQMLRLSSRLLQILQASMARVRKGVFDDGGRTAREYTRFKSTLNKILKRDYFVVRDFVDHVLSYCTGKYRRQFAKLRKYVERVEQGDEIWFRELYNKESSDVEVSPSPEQRRVKEEEKTVRKLHRKIDMEQHLSSTEQPEKKAISVKKTVKTSTKRKERLLNIKNKAKQEEDDDQPPSKEQTATKLYKFYQILDLNKKQFLQDYICEKADQQRHRAALLNKLLDRNRTINAQINSFIRKSTNYLPVPIAPTPTRSSGDERNERNQSLSSKVSLRTSFIISKRKASFHFDTSANEKAAEAQKLETSTVKNINPRRRSSHSNHRPQDHSKKLFVVKAPLIFEEEMIPQAPITQTQWLQAPRTSRGKEKKGDNIRMKRKNNVNPLQNAFLPQNFRYPF